MIKYFQVLSDPEETLSSYYTNFQVPLCFMQAMLMLTLFQEAKLGVMLKTLNVTVLYEEAQDHEGY